MPALGRTRSLTKRSSSGRLARKGHHSSKWSSDEGVTNRRKRSSDKMPGPNAEFNTFDDSSVSGTITSSLLLEKVERAIAVTGNRPKEAPEPKRSEAETPQPPTEPPRLPTTAPPSSAERNTVPEDASSTVTQQPTTRYSPRNKELQVVKANIKYKNEAGRAAVLAISETLHHDFGQLNNIINVTLPASELESLEENPDVVWIDRSGAVYFMQPYRSAK